MTLVVKGEESYFGLGGTQGYGIQLEDVITVHIVSPGPLLVSEGLGVGVDGSRSNCEGLVVGAAHSTDLESVWLLQGHGGEASITMFSPSL